MKEKLRGYYRELGVLGGFLFLVAVAWVGLWMEAPPPVEAGTCTVPHTLTFGQIPTDVQWNENFDGLAQCTSSLDDGNIATGANIDQDKLETLYNNSIFSSFVAAYVDHDARHEPNGADEMNDLDIGNTGTNVSLHAARHATGGADPLLAGSVDSTMLAPGLLAQVGGLNGRNVDTATMTETAVTLDARSHFTGTLSSNGAAVDTVQCAGIVYVLENGTTDRVWRIDPVTMTTASPASVTLTAGDDPQDIECAPDGSVYVITNNVAAGRALKKVTITGTLSTVTNLTTDSVCSGVPCLADNLHRMVIDSTGTYAFIIGSDGTDTENQQLYRVNLSGTVAVSVLEPDGDTDAFMTDMLIMIRNGVTKLWVMGVEDGNATGDYCCIFEVTHTTTPMTGSPGADCGGANTVIAVATGGAGPTSCASFEHDGTYLLAANTATNTLYRLGDLASIGAVSNLAPDYDPRRQVFSGKSMVFQEADAQVSLLTDADIDPSGGGSVIWNQNVCVGGTSPGVLCATACPGGGTCTGSFGMGRINMPWNIVNTTPCGLSTDGTHVYICADNAGSTAFSVAKHFID